jgi:hypothetical protein
MKTTIVLTLAASAYAMCPNSCSGHGSCGNDDLCHCYTDWLSGDESGGDCSERRCPYELAWFDTPAAPGTAHMLAECAGRGICDRSTGECSCFEGYSGKGCRRTTCPNDCSGHGTCEYLSEFRYDLGDAFKLTGDAPTTDLFNHSYYNLWDASKTMGCRCDPKWTDLDCSRRMCPKGSYALYDDSQPTYEVQTVSISGYTVGSADEFALTFRTTLNEEFTTKKLVASPFLMPHDVESALNELPNKVVEDVDVFFTSGAGDSFQAEVPSYEWHFTSCGDYGTTTSLPGSYGSQSATLSGSPVCDSAGMVLRTTGSMHAVLASVAMPLYTNTDGAKLSVQVIAKGLDATNNFRLLDIGGIANGVTMSLEAGIFTFTASNYKTVSGSAITTAATNSLVATFSGGSTAALSSTKIYLDGAAVTDDGGDTNYVATPTWGTGNYIGREGANYNDEEYTILTVRIWKDLILDLADLGYLSSTPPAINFDVTFMGASTAGDQNNLECRATQCAGGCQPLLANAITYKNASDITATTTATCVVGRKHPAKSTNTECSGRGRCDYGTGLCECFTGYTDEYCSTQSALI